MRTRFLTILAPVAVVCMFTATGYGRAFCDREPSGVDHSHAPVIRIVENAIVRSEGSQLAVLNSDPMPVGKTSVTTPVIPDANFLLDKTELTLNPETVLDDSLTTTAKPITVSKWLETRANEEVAGKTPANHSDTESLEFVQDEGMEVVGGGWCNNCGCWMRHGCDTNGNCGISHASVCGSGYCPLHPFSNCLNTN